ACTLAGFAVGRFDQFCPNLCRRTLSGGYFGWCPLGNPDRIDHGHNIQPIPGSMGGESCLIQYEYPNYMNTLTIVSILFLSAFLSGAAVFFVKRDNTNLLKLILSFSGAYLFTITVLHLIPHVYHSG